MIDARRTDSDEDDFVLGQSIPSRFEEIVRMHGDRCAIISDRWRPTFFEFNATANRLAHRLVSISPRNADRVAVLMRHDGPLIAAMLGILKAGRVAVVLNPSDPEARLSHALNDSEPACIVTDNSYLALACRLASDGCKVIQFDEVAGESEANPDRIVPSGDLALLKYTSGSTGRPKAVMQPHCNVLHNARRLQIGLGLQPNDRSTLLASLSGGQGLATLWSTLLAGATICPFPVAERGVTGLAQWLEEHRISVWVSPASLFRHFVLTLDSDRRFHFVRAVRLGSESGSWNDAASWRQHFDRQGFFLHTYSSTETGNVTQHRVTSQTPFGEGRLPIGPPVKGMELLLLNPRGSEVAPDEAGEIAIRSRYLSTGYWRREELTAQSFSGSLGPGEVRVFRTGDFARRQADGTLIFAGRSDQRVKVRGFRIDTLEIEEAIQAIEGIEKAVVRSRPVGNEDARLTAFIHVRATHRVEADSIRTTLRRSLPEASIPTEYHFVRHFPVTGTGKIDLCELDQLATASAGSVASSPPATPSELALAEIWRSALKRTASGAPGSSSVDRESNFFDLGGDSLSAAVVAAWVYAETKVQMDLRVFVEYPTLAGFAAAIDRRVVAGERSSASPLVRVSRDAPLPLSFLQERTWRFSRTPEQSAGYTVACLHRLVGPLDVELFRRCIDSVVRRHEVLRTTFGELDGVPVQRVQPVESIEIPIVDLSGEPDAAERADELLRREAQQPFDLARLPLLRFILVRAGDSEHYLLRINHHIISDAWSWRIFFHELAETYEAGAQSSPAPSVEVPRLQYADYAVWQRRTLDRLAPAYQESLCWWKAAFAGAPRPLELPIRRWTGTDAATPDDGLLWWGLDSGVSRRLEAVARSRGATYFMVRLAAFVTQLGWETDSTDVVLGMYATNRTHVETQRMFGFFANLTTLRVRLAPGESFAHRLGVVQHLVGEIQARGATPYEQLCEDLKHEGVTAPEIRAVFGVSDQRAPVRLGDVELTWVNRRVNAMPWGFSLSFDQHNEQNRCNVMFDARKYDPAWVNGFVKRYSNLLDAVSRDPDLICWPEHGTLDQVATLPFDRHPLAFGDPSIGSGAAAARNPDR